MEITAELKGHFMRLYQMALTDGDFSPSEWKLLYHFAEERGVPSEQLDRLLLTASGNVAIPETLQSKVDYLHDLCTMIWVDGKVTPDEDSLLKKYCRKFGFEEENIDEIASFMLKEVKAGRSKMEILQEIEAS